jgi:hypothetical protein
MDMIIDVDKKWLMEVLGFELDKMKENVMGNYNYVHVDPDDPLTFGTQTFMNKTDETIKVTMELHISFESQKNFGRNDK